MALYETGLKGTAFCDTMERPGAFWSAHDSLFFQWMIYITFKTSFSLTLSIFPIYVAVF
jgi:hypothetical protein